MSLFQGKYRIETARLQHWDYGANAAYFITICTKDKIPFFGKIENDATSLSEIGNIVYKEWLATPAIRPDMNLLLDEFIVMPNHFHGIIFIGDNEFNTNNMPQSATSASKFGPQSKNLSAIVRGFKSAVTMKAHTIDVGFKWQTRFHDHIIRNTESYLRIRNYIINNPINWREDTFYCH